FFADVSSSDNITFGIKGIFNFFWEWKPSSANCSLKYLKEMISLRNGYKAKEEGLSPHWGFEISGFKTFDMNDKLSLHVKTECNNLAIETLNKTVQLAPGDEQTAVINFHCVWHYQEHVKCTWQSGPNTPPNTTYRIFYWMKDTSTSKRMYTLAELWDLFETGRTCE
ncbi:unnamed protein product, partial [Staurois parvus]